MKKSMVKKTVSKAELMLPDSKVCTQTHTLLFFFSSQFRLLYRFIEHTVNKSTVILSCFPKPFLPVLSHDHSLRVCAFFCVLVDEMVM